MKIATARQFGKLVVLVTNAQVASAAKAYMEWQFPGKEWETASLSLQSRFMEGARIALTAALS